MSDSPPDNPKGEVRWRMKREVRPGRSAPSADTSGGHASARPGQSVTDEELMALIARTHEWDTGEEAEPVWAGCCIHAVNGVELICDPAGIAYCPAEDTMLVADLHLEKGAAFARRGQLVPPYDTAMTLSRLARTLARWRPKRVVALGDSFHDGDGAALMGDRDRETLTGLMAGRDWVWISGNHDPEPPQGLGGETMERLSLGPLTLIHEPSPDAGPGEIAGHLHPKARVTRRGRTVSKSCFAVSRSRMVMPSFGAYTGGLSVFHRAFAGLFDGLAFHALMRGSAQVYRIRASDLSR